MGCVPNCNTTLKITWCHEMLNSEREFLLVAIMDHTPPWTISASLLIYLSPSPHKSSFQPFSIPLPGETALTTQFYRITEFSQGWNPLVTHFKLPSFLLLNVILSRILLDDIAASSPTPPHSNPLSPSPYVNHQLPTYMKLKNARPAVHFSAENPTVAYCWGLVFSP